MKIYKTINNQPHKSLAFGVIPSHFMFFSKPKPQNTLTALANTKEKIVHLLFIFENIKKNSEEILPNNEKRLLSYYHINFLNRPCNQS